MLQSDRYRRSDRAAAIQSMGLLLERRKQHWNDGEGDISSIQHEWEDNVGIRDWTSSQNQTQQGMMDEENVHGGFLTKNGRSILKGGSNNLAGCGKKIRDLNNNHVGEAKPRHLEDGIGNVAGGKKGLRWKEDHHLCQQLAENDADGQEPPASFRCCSVCGGRIWAGDQKSGAMGLEQQEGEELLVHWACFQCATCGLDLGNESQERVFKRDGRFYCHVHGPTALMAAAAGNNQQQKKQQQPQLQQLNGNGEAAVLGTGNGKAAAKREPEKMREVEAESLRLAAKNEGGHQQQQQWWERSADQFNGNKKSSTTIRYYGPGEGGHGAAGHWTNGQRNHKSSFAESRSTGNGTVSNGTVSTGLAIKSNNNDSQPTKLATMTSAKILSQDNNHNQISNHSSSHKRYTFLDKTDKTGNHSAADGGPQQKSWNWLGGGSGGKSAPLIIEKQQQQPKSGAAANEDRCEHCGLELRGSFVLAKGRAWCPDHFCCANSACARTLLDSGFVEDPASRRNYCPKCYEVLLAPVCHKCSLPLTESCLNALGNKWHPDCFCCSHCRKPFGTLSFFVENGQPYCEDDWNQLFTTKCAQCHGPIKVGQKWLEALGGRSFHANCFKCTTCQTVLEGQTFFERDQRPYCRAHAIQQQQQQQQQHQQQQNGRR